MQTVWEFIILLEIFYRVGNFQNKEFTEIKTSRKSTCSCWGTHKPNLSQLSLLCFLDKPMILPFSELPYTWYNLPVGPDISWHCR